MNLDARRVAFNLKGNISVLTFKCRVERAKLSAPRHKKKKKKYIRGNKSFKR